MTQPFAWYSLSDTRATCREPPGTPTEQVSKAQAAALVPFDDPQAAKYSIVIVQQQKPHTQRRKQKIRPIGIAYSEGFRRAHLEEVICRISYETMLREPYVLLTYRYSSRSRSSQADSFLGSVR